MGMAKPMFCARNDRGGDADHLAARLSSGRRCGLIAVSV
jgi:hypothetical protein